jgi:hypothetical protein
MTVMTDETELTPKPSRVWLWIFAAFAIQIAAWTGWFVIAAKHRVQEVPLASAR